MSRKTPFIFIWMLLSAPFVYGNRYITDTREPLSADTWPGSAFGLVYFNKDGKSKVHVGFLTGRNELRTTYHSTIYRLDDENFQQMPNVRFSPKSRKSRYFGPNLGTYARQSACSSTDDWPLTF